MDDNAVEVLETEHADLQKLFDRVSSPDEDRREVLKVLLQTLSVHVGVEEQMLTPVVKDRVANGEAIAEKLEDDHHRIEKILTLLARRKANSPDVPDMVNELLEITDGHVEQARSDIFPGLREALSADELEELGRRMQSDERRELTHPHPAVPDSGPLAGIASKAAELVDRARDRSHDVGRTSS